MKKYIEPKVEIINLSISDVMLESYRMNDIAQDKSLNWNDLMSN